MRKLNDKIPIFVPLFQAMRKVVTISDIKSALGMKGFFGSCVASAAYGVCGLGKINKVFDSAADYQGREFAEQVLKTLNITCNIEQSQLDCIPKVGGFVVVSNHPFGAIEGVMLYAAIAKVRPDFKVMANFLLSRIPNLKDAFFSVNPFTENPEWKSSVGGVKGAINHLAEGKGLGVFPAGEVSRYHGHDYPEDLPWSKSIARIIKNAGVPVIPVFWEGQNSRVFYFLDRINEMLGTARLPRELLNKHDKHITLQIGKPVTVAEISDYYELQVSKATKNKLMKFCELIEGFRELSRKADAYETGMQIVKLSGIEADLTIDNSDAECSSEEKQEKLFRQKKQTTILDLFTCCIYCKKCKAIIKQNGKYKGRKPMPLDADKFKAEC